MCPLTNRYLRPPTCRGPFCLCLHGDPSPYAGPPVPGLGLCRPSPVGRSGNHWIRCRRPGGETCGDDSRNRPHRPGSRDESRYRRRLAAVRSPEFAAYSDCCCRRSLDSYHVRESPVASHPTRPSRDRKSFYDRCRRQLAAHNRSPRSENGRRASDPAATTAVMVTATVAAGVVAGDLRPSLDGCCAAG